MAQNYKHLAALACNMLREQLRDQELNDLVRKHYRTGVVKSDFIFTDRKELDKKLEERVSKWID